jgi:hypothetical protein
MPTLTPCIDEALARRAFDRWENDLSITEYADWYLDYRLEASA